MGTPEFAVPSLEALVRDRWDVACVVTAPDKPVGRGLHVRPSPVKSAALAAGIEVLQPETPGDPAFHEALRARRPDIIAVVAFRILPTAVIEIPALGAFNLHASLLPRYRGAAPINHALMNGETVTGVTTFFLERTVDTGNVILQRQVDIEPEDDAGTLHDRLSLVGAEAVAETVRLIVEGTAPRIPQDVSKATPAPKIFREQCRIEWNRPARAVVNQIRGLSPHPGPFTFHEGREIHVYRAAVAPEAPALAPGEIAVESGQLIVGTGEGAVRLLELQQQGRKRMGAGEFLRGYRFGDGARFAVGPIPPGSG
jgi:methionyl-tRNA formyltransferase